MARPFQGIKRNATNDDVFRRVGAPREISPTPFISSGNENPGIAMMRRGRITKRENEISSQPNELIQNSNGQNQQKNNSQVFTPELLRHNESSDLRDTGFDAFSGFSQSAKLMSQQVSLSDAFFSNTDPFALNSLPNNPKTNMTQQSSYFNAFESTREPFGISSISHQPSLSDAFAQKSQSSNNNSHRSQHSYLTDAIAKGNISDAFENNKDIFSTTSQSINHTANMTHQVISYDAFEYNGDTVATPVHSANPKSIFLHQHSITNAYGNNTDPLKDTFQSTSNDSSNSQQPSLPESSEHYSDKHTNNFQSFGIQENISQQPSLFNAPQSSKIAPQPTIAKRNISQQSSLYDAFDTVDVALKLESSTSNANSVYQAKVFSVSGSLDANRPQIASHTSTGDPFYNLFHSNNGENISQWPNTRHDENLFQPILAPQNSHFGFLDDFGNLSLNSAVNKLDDRKDFGRISGGMISGNDGNDGNVHGPPAKPPRNLPDNFAGPKENNIKYANNDPFAEIARRASISSNTQ